MEEGIYTIAELADLGGVSRRTVRYYVQRGLLPSPTGLGRGKHYTQAHLDRLLRIRSLQDSGVPLAEIPQRLVWEESETDIPFPTEATPTQQVWTRIVLREGVELHLSGKAAALDTATLQQLAQAVTEVLERKKD